MIGKTVKKYAGGFVDLHSHILPGVDDGSKDVEMSLIMLDMLRRQGVERVVATPHYYPSKETPSEFLTRRAEAETRLASSLSSGENRIIVFVGAEVEAFPGMSRSADIKEMCIMGTEALLVEMPFRKWSDSLLSELISLRERRGIVPVIAHAERYLMYQDRSVWTRLLEEELIIQLNTDDISSALKSRGICDIILNGGPVLLGSDCHNITDRCPDFISGVEYIGKKFGWQAVEEITACSEKLTKSALALIG